ncbi:MAG: ATP-binding cassette domain-containing protein [Alphaproteobacteria bacterium]|nr:ATP-binding cassette domain-containing protein [Alphaproteobacteria bacterium]
MNIKNNSLVYLSIYLKKYKLNLFLVFVALVFSALSVLSIGVAVRYFVNYGFSSGDSNSLNIAAITLSGILLVLALSSAIRSYLINMICEKVVIDINRDIYKRLLNTSISYFEKISVSDLVSRLTNDTQLIQNVINSVFSFFIRNSIMMIGGIILLFATNTLLTMYVVTAVPVIVFPIMIISKKVRSSSKDAQTKLSRMGSHIAETLSGIRLVKVSNAEKYEENNFAHLTKEYIDSAIMRNTSRSMLVGIVIGLVSISTLVVLWIGGHQVLLSNMSSGELVSFVFYSIIVASSMGGMSEVIGDINRASGAAERIVELYSLESSSNSVIKSNALEIDKSINIDFEKVSFYYPSRAEKNILENFSFSMHSGDKVALVGKSGSGKTTIVSLLLRFYKPTKGKIIVNDVDIQTLSVKELRDRIGIVSQETFIFSNTALYNIAYGSSGKSKEEIINAAKLANIHEFIESLPEGYNTHLGERGSALSGGQKQRIAIARVLLKDPQILILDEATSNLDEENAKIIQCELESLMKSRATLIISHRANAVRNCNKIISLDEGKIIDCDALHEKKKMFQDI